MNSFPREHLSFLDEAAESLKNGGSIGVICMRGRDHRMVKKLNFYWNLEELHQKNQGKMKVSWIH
jgi:16S rRNA C1402 N4-methylase RsmH